MAADLSEELVAAIDGVSGGPYAGRRAAHAKGSFCEGSFTATERARELSRAEHLAGSEIPVTVRFSNGTGNPDLPDNERTDGRGMAVKFRVPDGPEVDSVTITIPVFFVSTPEAFLAFTRAREPDPESGQPNMEKIGAVIAERPEIGAALQLILPTLTPPVSYATCTYNSLHAFCLVNGEDERTWARLRWRPEAGEHVLPEEEIDGQDSDYLQDEVRERLDREPVRFRLDAILAADEDPLDDPTKPWPDDREAVELGVMELTRVVELEEPVIFDPNNLADGIEPSEDAILAARSPAYSVSIERRMAGG